jgi:hypothetical protein
LLGSSSITDRPDGVPDLGIRPTFVVSKTVTCLHTAEVIDRADGIRVNHPISLWIGRRHSLG